MDILHYILWVKFNSLIQQVGTIDIMHCMISIKVGTMHGYTALYDQYNSRNHAWIYCTILWVKFNSLIQQVRTIHGNTAL